MTPVKRLNVIILVIILVPIIIWFALGPGMRSYIERKSDEIIREVKRRTDENILIGSVSGDFWSGIKLERVVVYTDKDEPYLPLISTDEVTVKISLSNLLKGNATPTTVHISGFNASLHIGPDGKIALPEWTIQTAGVGEPVFHAGYLQTSDRTDAVHITFEDGILEIHKLFPRLTETVNVVFTKLEGTGNYFNGEGFEIEEITGDYLSTPIVLEGNVPIKKNEPMDITASIGTVTLATIFRDIDPLFRGNTYLPDGTTSTVIQISGTPEELTVTGNVTLVDAYIGNAKIESADASISYNAGIIDLSEGVIEAYGGRANATGRINLLSATPLWNGICTFEDLDLPVYLEENNYFSNEMTGEFSGSLDAHGDFSNPDSFSCILDIESANGHYLSPFSDRFTHMISGSMDESEVRDEEMTDFDDLTIRARINQSEILIERFHFVSMDLQVEATGTVGFNKSIEARGGLSVPLESARNHPRFGRYVNVLPDTLNRASLEFSLSGYIYDIEFRASPSENLLRGLVDDSSDFLHDLGDLIPDF